METRAKAAGHPIHPMLVTFPIGLLGTTVIFDVLYLFTDRPGFAIAAAYMIAAGVISGVVAGLLGLIDWSGIPSGTRAKRIGALHGLGNLMVLVLFAASWILRVGAENWQPSIAALVCSFGGVAAMGGTGWLGGELVDRLGVGVAEGAHLDAPSSLSGQPAQSTAPPARHKPA